MNCLEDRHMNYDIVEKYITVNVAYFAHFGSSAMWKAILYEISVLQALFVWNFTDIMTMCASMYLVSYFRDLNSFIAKETAGKTANWSEIRLHYSHLVQLLKAVDSQLSYLILLSYFTNVYYICIQLFNATKTLNSTAHKAYYTYSFIFLMFRFSVTSTLAVSVNTEANKPIRVLRDVPSEEYNVEVHRFIRQIRYSNTALSGVFFYITKGMILSALGMIITYEVVLLQFSTKKVVPWTDRHNHTSYIHLF